MFTLRIPTSKADFNEIFREKSDKRYRHNKQVVRNMYNDIVSTLSAKNKNFREPKELKDCLVRGLKAIE